MINFFNFFENIFDTDRISDDNLRKFCEDHIGRLTQNNSGGEFTIILTDITNKYTLYFGKMSNEDIAFAVQQSLTATVDNLIESFKDEASKQEKLISYHFAETTPAYQEFYPQGVTEYRNATKANVELLMARMVSACTAHQAVLGPAIVTLFTGFKTNFPLARNAQILKISEVTSDKTLTATTRNDIETQLIGNLHFIGFTFPGNPTRCMDFVDQSIIRASQSSASDGIGRAAGIITNETTGIPIGDVVVDYVGLFTPSKKSKPDGNYKAANAPVGAQHVRFSKPGFIAIEVPIILDDAGDTALDISLRPE